MPDFRVKVLFLLLIASSLHLSALDYPQREFIANISDAVPEWNVHKAYNADEAQILTAVTEGLCVYDPYNMDPLPAVAQSWTVSADSLVWTFKLRDNARFENGDPITARTFRDSWIALLAPAAAAPYASLLDPIKGAADYRTAKTSSGADVGIRALDNTTLQVTLNAPAEHLAKILCHHAFSAVHPSALSPAGAAQRPFISSGPYQIGSISDTEILLIKNTRYWDADAVKIPSIRLLLEKEGDSLTERFNRGEIDWLAGAMDLEKIADPAAIKITPMFATEYFFFRTTWGPWADTEIRMALSLAVPWEKLREGNLIGAKTLVFPIAGYPQLDGITETNPEKAADQMKAWSVRTGKTTADIPPLVIRIPESSVTQALAEILSEAWTRTGFTVRIETLPYATYYSSLRTDDYALAITSWIGDFADPLAFLDMFRPLSSLNDSGWKNPDFDRLLDAAGLKAPLKDRYSRLAEAETLLLNERVILPVSHSLSVNCIDTDGIAGWYRNPLDIHPFKFIRFTQRQALPGVAMVTGL